MWLSISCYHGVNFCDIGKEAGAAAGVPVKEKLTNKAFCLTLPGRVLNISDLTAGKKFRSRGWKMGALEVMRNLEADGLGEHKPIDETHPVSYLETEALFVFVFYHLILNNSQEQYTFRKAALPEEDAERVQFAKKLMKHNVSLVEYAEKMQEPEYKP